MRLGLSAPLAVLAVSLSACAGIAHLDPKELVPPELELSPASLGRNLSLSQMVEGYYADRVETLRMEVEADRQRLVVVGLSPLGMTLFVLEQNSTGLTFETVVADEIPLDPRFLLFDLQATLWPTTALAKALQAEGLRLEESAEGTWRRVFRADGRLYVEISYLETRDFPRRTVIRHLDPDYRVDVTTLAARQEP